MRKRAVTTSNTKSVEANLRRMAENVSGAISSTFAMSLLLVKPHECHAGEAFVEQYERRFLLNCVPAKIIKFA
ncbi:MAG: hypothetical protein CTY36_00665 [Methylocystis sp.]|nr:MAG: hypothetical protein CTY36_00665 [Methylocystis sp.]